VATTAKIAKNLRKQKFAVRYRNRCKICGRPRGYSRKFGLCRIHLRNLALQGYLPGVIKASW
jgi:small subunit ribosomal protein S14